MNYSKKSNHFEVQKIGSSESWGDTYSINVAYCMYVKYIIWKYLQLLKVLIGVISTPFASKTLIKDSFKMLSQEIG